MHSLFAPLTGIEIQDFRVHDDVLVVEIRLSINQTNRTLEQLAAKMQQSHLDLMRLLIDDLKQSGAPERPVQVLRSLHNEQSKVEPEWFNSAEHFGEATRRALDKQHQVYQMIGKPSMWGLDDDGCFQDPTTEQNVDERWKVTSKMRAVAQMAACLGARGFDPAINLLRMALNPKHLIIDGHDPQLQQSPSDTPPAQMTRKPFDLRESIHENMDVAIMTSLQQVGITESISLVDRDVLRIAYYILKEGTVQPWPPLLVKVLAGLSKSELLQAFIQLCKIALTEAEFENPFKPGASVLFYNPAEKTQTRDSFANSYRHSLPSRWEMGRIHNITEANEAGSARIDVQLRGTKVVEGLEPKHVLYISTAGVGALLREAARQGCTQLLECMLDANISPFYCDRHANTALIEAAREKHADACRLLVARGLDVHVFNRFRLNTYDVAVRHRDVKTLRAVTPSKSDCEAEEDKKAVSDGKLQRHELHLAVGDDTKTEAEIVEALEALKASDVNAPTAGGERTSLMIAARRGQLKTVQKLLGMRADVNIRGVTQRGSRGASAVTIAAEEGHLEILKCARAPPACSLRAPLPLAE